MDELIKAMTNEQLEAIKVEHADNPSIQTLVDGILETRASEVAQVAVKAKFEAAIAKLVSKGIPVPPEGVHNVYIRYAEVEVPEGEPEEVAITNPDTGEVTTEMRQATTKVWQWVVEVNKATSVTSKSAGGNGSTKDGGKRTIVVKQIVGDTVVDCGEYPSGADF